MNGIALVLALVFTAALSAGGYFKVQQWKDEARTEGVAECQAAHVKADAELKAKGDIVIMDAKDHISDMEVAYEQGKKDAEVRVVTKVVRAESDVRSGAIPTCALPAASLLNLNAARLSMRRETAPTDATAPVPATTAPLRPAEPVKAAPPARPSERQPLSKGAK